MKKQIISKILAVVMAFSFVGMTTQASAATTETVASEAAQHDPLTITGVTVPETKVNQETCAYASTHGGNGIVKYYFLLLKDGKEIAKQRSEYKSWGSSDFYFTPREAGKYTLYVEVQDQYGFEKLTTTKEFTVAESDKEISTPVLYMEEQGPNMVRLYWDPSVAKNCKLNAYYLIVDGGATILPRYQQFYDYKLDGTMHTAFVIGQSQDGAEVTWSLNSNTVIIPAKN